MIFLLSKSRCPSHMVHPWRKGKARQVDTWDTLWDVHLVFQFIDELPLYNPRENSWGKKIELFVIMSIA